MVGELVTNPKHERKSRMFPLYPCGWSQWASLEKTYACELPCRCSAIVQYTSFTRRCSAGTRQRTLHNHDLNLANLNSESICCDAVRLVHRHNHRALHWRLLCRPIRELSAPLLSYRTLLHLSISPSQSHMRSPAPRIHHCCLFLSRRDSSRHAALEHAKRS